MRTALSVTVLLTTLSGFPAWADQVTLTNGDRVTGRIVELTAENLRFQTEFFGEVSIPRSAVASFSTDQVRAVTLPGARVVEGTLSARESQVVIQTEAGPLTVPDKELTAVRTREAQAAYEKSLNPSWLHNWQLGLDVALSSRGGGGTTSMNASVEGIRRTRNDELTLFYHSFLEREQKGAVVNDDKTRAVALYTHKLTERMYYFGTTDFDLDALQHLNLRWVLSGGLGRRLKRTRRVNFDVLGGGGSNQEFFQDEPTRRSAEGVVGEDLKWQLTPSAYFQERLILYPNLNKPGEYRAQLSCRFELKINSWLSWRLTYSNHFLSDPPPDTKKNDNLLTSGIHLTFGKTAEGFQVRP